MTSSQQQQQQQEDFFNLITLGQGYLNRVRWVQPSRQAGRRSEPFLACSISALRGHVDSPASTYFDLRVTGEEAIEMIDSLEADVNAKAKVFLSFNIGDIYPHLYEREVRDERGRKTGEKEWAALIKGRLLLIKTITIDGERVFTRDANGEDLGTDTPQQDAVVQPEPEPALQRTQATQNQRDPQQQQAAGREPRRDRWNRSARTAGRQFARAAAQVAQA